MSARAPLIAVYGSSTKRESDAAWQQAYALGAELARHGAAVMTGGYGGIMEACSRGAHEAGGHVVGVTVELFEARGPVNRWVKERIHTPDLHERLRVIVDRADGFIAAPGSIGTLTELFLTWTLLSVKGRPSAPLVLMGDHWRDYLDAHRHPDLVVPHLFEFVQVASGPAEAARLALAGVPAR
ncbi:MAG: LOG family protein [Candidatus Eisenbacteria bacterium]|uniref:LOG family protein n=1 Tax=Eiseniibacteriota bacterium TaxID=2212470 RepID=A0A538TZE5_UNCEI|nr:MAG: LOG family protein [Candidatus Eisenbacteria bacterium]